ncbi:hypothetical protein [Prevotella communis]|uniref:hypothetical protein n=1 Tax=Prevotella communis TaxID=2913614 RepID=UPI001EDADCE2|nr:hypothetical protein [Prevotella communis]UKK67751.1 hypothetical protein L6464_14270 [Prevotella communis]
MSLCAQLRVFIRFFDKERYNVYVVEMKGTDWQVFLHDGTTTRMTVHDFSFKEDGKKRTFDYVYITIHGTPGEETASCRASWRSCTSL